MISKLLVFDLKGRMAHFRKFYTSSSSLSYGFPPRTTITGIIGAILGRERDTYYDEFGIENCRIALSIRTLIRKVIQTVNYIRTKEEDGYSTPKGVINQFIRREIEKYPTPIELVIPTDLTKEIAYRIYFWHQDDEVMHELNLKVSKRMSVYPIYLGLSEFLAEVVFVDETSDIRKTDHQPVDLVSILRTDYIDELLFEEEDTPLQYIAERMPLCFGREREIKRNEEFIYEKNQKVVKAKLKVPSIEVLYKEAGRELREKILFME